MATQQFEEPVIEITRDVNQLRVTGIATLVTRANPESWVQIHWVAERQRPTEPWRLAHIQSEMHVIKEDTNKRPRSQDHVPKSLLVHLERAGWQTETLAALREYTSHQLERALAALKSA